MVESMKSKLLEDFGVCQFGFRANSSSEPCPFQASGILSSDSEVLKVIVRGRAMMFAKLR